MRSLLQRLTLLVALLATALLSLPGRALADELTTHAEAVCRKGEKIALVRFTTAWNNEAPVYRRLPSSVDAGLSGTTASLREDCTMANGWSIRVRSSDKQAFPYGAGGGDPPAFFSLWIAGRKVISREEWKPGYGNTTDAWLVAVVIRPNRLTTCRVAYSQDAPAKGELTCSDRPLHLASFNVDAVEYAKPGTKPPVGTMLVLPGSPAPSVCSEYLRIRRGSWPESSMMVDSARIFHPVSTLPPLRLAEAIVEVSPGVRRKLVNWGSDGHYFDGDLMFIAPVSADARATLKPEMLDSADEFPADKLPTGWHLISGGQPSLYPDVSWRYVHFDSQKIGGRLYLLAQPTNREQKPTAILVQPLPSGFRSVCRFQRVELNF